MVLSHHLFFNLRLVRLCTLGVLGKAVSKICHKEERRRGHCRRDPPLKCLKSRVFVEVRHLSVCNCNLLFRKHRESSPFKQSLHHFLHLTNKLSFLLYVISPFTGGCTYLLTPPHSPICSVRKIGPKLNIRLSLISYHFA